MGKNTWPPRSYNAYDADESLILADQAAVAASTAGKIGAVVTEVDTEKYLGAIVAVNFQIKNMTKGGAETYDLKVQGSNDDFVTVREQASKLIDDNVSLEVSEGVTTILMMVTTAKLRTFYTLAGAAPAFDVKVWISPVDSP